VAFAIENTVKPISLIARAYIEECEGIYQGAREASKLLPVQMPRVAGYPTI